MSNLVIDLADNNLLGEVLVYTAQEVGARQITADNENKLIL